MTDGSTIPANYPLLTPAETAATASDDLPKLADDSVYHGTKEAEAEAAGVDVVAGLQSGFYATIEACVAVCVARAKFRGDQQATTAFIRPLIDAKVLPAKANDLGFSSKLSRLSTVGQCADQLRQPALANYFLEIGSWGYSVLHEATILLGQMPAGLPDNERASSVVKTLRQEGVTTRRGMIQLTKTLKDAKRNTSANTLPARAPAVASTIADTSIAGETVSIDENSDTKTVEVAKSFDLIFAATNRFDVSKLREPREESLLPRCLCSAANGDVADNAVMIVVSRLSDVPTIKDRLFPYCGFEGVRPRVFLLNQPPEPEVTDAQVMVVVTHRLSDCVRWETISRFADAAQLDLLALAEKLVPSAKSKLQLFATSENEGWYSIVGEDNWSVADE
jgi:hypothetical protein